MLNLYEVPKYVHGCKYFFCISLGGETIFLVCFFKYFEILRLRGPAVNPKRRQQDCQKQLTRVGHFATSLETNVAMLP